MELPHIGRHCSLVSCKSLDFLPIGCPFCKEIFCGDHRLPLQHECNSWSTYDKKVSLCSLCEQLVYVEHLSPEDTLKQHVSSDCKLYRFPTTPPASLKTQCAVHRCHEMDARIGPTHCNACNNDFCLKHRYQATHECPALQVDTKELRRVAAEEKLAKTYKPISSSSPSSNTSLGNKITKKRGSPTVEWMIIKAKAKGLSPVPMESRIYLYVRFPEESSLSRHELPMYFDKYNRVGKTLDILADYSHLKNENHLLAADNDQRLCCFLEDRNGATRLLDMSTTLENAAEQMMTLIIRRQGAKKEGTIIT